MTPSQDPERMGERAKALWQSLEGGEGTCNNDDVAKIARALSTVQRETWEAAAKRAFEACAGGAAAETCRCGYGEMGRDFRARAAASSHQ